VQQVRKVFLVLLLQWVPQVLLVAKVQLDHKVPLDFKVLLE
jgi:hypothetical protein